MSPSPLTQGLTLYDVHGCLTQNRGELIIFNQYEDIPLRDVDQFRCVEDKFDGDKFNEMKITIYNKTKNETIQLCPKMKLRGNQNVEIYWL